MMYDLGVVAYRLNPKSLRMVAANHIRVFEERAVTRPSYRGSAWTIDEVLSIMEVTGDCLVDITDEKRRIAAPAERAAVEAEMLKRHQDRTKQTTLQRMLKMFSL